MRPPKKNTNILLVIFALLFIQSALGALDPDVYRSFQEIVTSKGYPCENYTVQTSDGYLLGLFRIVKNDNKPRPPVLLMHGLLDSAFTWIVNFPHQSLAYILADNGYDVWMGNVRGNTYSRAHIKLNPNDQEFWQFSWDEFAAIDVPQTIDYILKVTNRKKLSYVGHSQGTMQMFSGLSVNPSLSDKLNLFIGLGPVITITHMTNPFIPIAASLNLDEFLYFFGFKEFLPTISGIAAILGEWFCHYQPDYCANIIELICGPHKGAFNSSRMEVIVSHEPGGTSVMNLWHWGQLYRSRTWQMFDYGSDKENMLHYNQTKPPAYSLNKINKNLPIALFYGDHDELADPTDVQNLIKALPFPPVFVKEIKEYAHLDFAWALDAPTVMYADMITLLNKYN